MSENINFFNHAIRLLRVENQEAGDIGTTEQEFAENYANASGAEKNSSIWNNYFEEGKKEYQIINSDGIDGITQEEFNKVQYYVDKITQPFKHRAEDFLAEFDGNNKYIADIRTRVSDEDLLKDDKKEASDNIKVEQKQSEEIAKLKEQILSLTRGEEQSGISKFKDAQGKPKLEVNMPERKNLKIIREMTREEIIAELKEYDSNYEVLPKTNTEVLIKYLEEARLFNVKNDKNSDTIDHHIGTFSQGGHGTCTMLSKINGLENSDLERIYQETPVGSGNYRVTFPFEYGNDDKAVIVTKEELESGEITIIGDDGKEYKINDFTQGDKDVMLLEMAFMKRFGTYISPNGADIKMIEEIFTFPEYKEGVTPEEQRTAESYQITEDKIIQSLDNKNNPIIGLKMVSRMPADFSYQDTVEVKTADGTTISAHWGFGSSIQEIDARDSLKRLLGPSSPLYSKIDDMPVGEFMDLANKFVGAKFDNKSRYRDLPYQNYLFILYKIFDCF